MFQLDNIRSIENGTFNFYENVGCHSIDIEVTLNNENKHVKTKLGAKRKDNLLGLGLFVSIMLKVLIYC